MSSPSFSTLLFLILLFSSLEKARQDKPIPVDSVITANRNNSIHAASAWYSPSRRFAFGFYAAGTDNLFAVGVWLAANASVVVWTADRDGGLLPESTTLKLTRDGLQIPSTAGDRSIANISATEARLASASMLDSGNFVILDVNGNIMWQTFDYPTDTLISGQILRAGQKLVSSVSDANHSSGKFQIVMQANGNLVAFPVNTPQTYAHAYWLSDTDGDGYTGITLQAGGYLLLVRGLNATLNLSNGANFARVDPDGFLRVYSINGSSAQITNQMPGGLYGADKCSIKGACGANSYCNSSQGEEAECLCFPGFNYSDSSKPETGCQRNFSMGQCEEDISSFSIASLANVSWNDDPYDFNDNSTQTDCGYSCLRDCNCYAALFAYGRCSKQRHPLLYGRRSAADPTVALLKVGAGEIGIEIENEIEERIPTTETLILYSAVGLTSFIALTIAIFVFLCINRGQSYHKLCRSMEAGLAGGTAPRFFTYRQLKTATEGFSKLLGSGGFSKVFKGEIRTSEGEATLVAVKRLDQLSASVNASGFRTEMRAVGRAHHRNVVRLLGFCHEGPNWLLVYEYMSRGSLADLIFKGASNRPSWKQRVGIAMDVARGILYLHEGCETAIIHSDIKPQNVLVGEEGTAKIGDLGLAKLLRPRQSETYTRRRGTTMYKAPEWGEDTGEPVSCKVDVYSFGVLLLELIACRKYYQRGDEMNADGLILSKLAYKCLTESTLERMLPGKNDAVDAGELEKMVMVALWCVQKDPTDRKSMKEVLLMLGGKMPVPLPPCRLSI